jgi:hypothetical protein
VSEPIFWCNGCSTQQVGSPGELCSICKGFERVRIARQEKIDRYKPKRTAYRQPYKDNDDRHA